MAQPRLIPDPDPPQAAQRAGGSPAGGPAAKRPTGKPAARKGPARKPAAKARQKTPYVRPGLGARLLRVLASFGIVVSAYVAYALAVVPIIEPSADKIDSTPGPIEPPPPPRTDALVPYFPPDAWELKDPKILESERAMLLIKGYQNLPDGRVKLTPCTVVFFASDSTREDQKSPPVILQAPEGAILKFDEPFDLKRAKIGRLIGGSLVGKVTIRRDPSRPGAADDLRVTTRDVELVDDRVVTPHPVDFHFGPSYGSGREMTILLARNVSADGGAPQDKKGLGITGVKSFELAREVRMHMLPGGKDPQDLMAPDKDVTPPRRSADPPVEVTCQGPFQFNLEKYVATFNDQVDVLRLNTNGPSDQLNCDQLLVYFARREQAEAKTKTAGRAPAKAPPPTANLEARSVEARGNPVIVRSPSTGGQARCQRLEYDLRSGRVSLQGTGTLQGALPRNPAQKYHARWSKELRFEPHSTLPQAGSRQPAQMFSIVGGAQVRLADVGSRTPSGAPQPAALSAEEIHAWLDPPPADRSAGPNSRPASSSASAPAGGNAAPTPGIGRGEASELRPKRLLAQGSVRLDSVPLSGSTGRLEVFFAAAESPAAPGRAGGAPGQTGAARPGAAQPGRQQQQFRFAGSSVQVRFLTRGEESELSDVLLEGNAELREAKTAKPDDKPLVITGDRLQLSGGDGPDSQVTVLGVPAYVEARGLSITGKNIQLERRSNRLWVDGAGKMTLPTAGAARAGTPRTASLRTTAPAGPQKLQIDWAGRMNFDGRAAVFERSIVAHTSQQLLRTERLEVTLKRTLDFANPPSPDRKSDPAEIDQIVCQGGAFLENRSWDERGLASVDRMQTLDLAINDTTGGIDAHGPGWVSSVRRGVPAPAAPPGLPGSGAKPAGEKANPKSAEQKEKDKDKLSFLNVNFARAITGNLHTRELTFADQVKTVYGPVADWEQKLDAENPEALPPEGVIMTCDQLTVRETAERMPSEPDRQERGYLELEAVGSTLVEGMGFTARAHRLTFAEKKSLLVLDGDGQSDAQLFRQPVPGGPTSQAAARRILYWQATNRVEIDDARFFDFGQFNLGKKQPDAPYDPNAKPAPAKPKTTLPKRTAPARGGAATTGS